jgi:hypothetical protein
LVNFFAAIYPRRAHYRAAACTEFKNRCIRDFLRAAAFFLIIPFRAAVSIFLTISRNAASAAATSFFRANAVTVLALVLTALFTALLRMRRSSLCRCRFSADVLLPAKGYPQKLITQGRCRAPAALFKIRRTPFKALAFFTFRDVFDFTVLEEGLHFDFPPAGTEKFLRRA